ncbi:hypothetical protein [Ancrocorticia populi]
MSRNFFKVGAAAAAVMALTAACAQTSDSGDSGDNTSGGDDSAAIAVGTTDKVSSLDPAGSYDNGSFVVMNQV